MTPERLQAAHEIANRLIDAKQLFEASVILELIGYATPPEHGRLVVRRVPMLMDEKLKPKPTVQEPNDK